MTRGTYISLIALFGSACVTVSDSENFTFSDVGLVVANTDKGTVEYDGRDTSTDVDVKITSWARAAGRAKAKTKQQENSYSANAADGVLTILGDTGFAQAGIDLDVSGPSMMDLDLNADSGSVFVHDTIGVANVSGSSLNLSNFEGDLTADGRDSVWAEVYPFEGGRVDITSDGSCTVYLPAYAPISLEVEFDPEQESNFAELGLVDDVFLGDGFYSAIRIPGDIIVNVRCPNGAVDIVEHQMTW